MTCSTCNREIHWACKHDTNQHWSQDLEQSSSSLSWMGCGWVHTGYVLNQLGNRSVVSQGAACCLHVRQLRHKLLYLSHCFSIVAFLSKKGDGQVQLKSWFTLIMENTTLRSQLKEVDCKMGFKMMKGIWIVNNSWLVLYYLLTFLP